jgi:predicted ATP-grasp superfamily ATP-dependent carboligase
MVDQRDFNGWNQLVIKPRDGAGCMDLFRFSDVKAAREYVQQRQDHFHCHEKWIVQKWLEGRHASRSIIVSNSEVVWLPWMTQEFEIEESSAHRCVTLSYCGAYELDLLDTPQSRNVIESIVDQYRSEMQGWIGFDFVIPQANFGEELPVLIEINPRFTTSFAHIDLNSVKIPETLFKV